MSNLFLCTAVLTFQSNCTVWICIWKANCDSYKHSTRQKWH